MRGKLQCLINLPTFEHIYCLIRKFAGGGVGNEQPIHFPIGVVGEGAEWIDVLKTNSGSMRTWDHMTM